MRARLRKIRVRKEDSAYVYFILESHEGIVAYSTLDFKAVDCHRDLLLIIPPDFGGEVQELLQRLAPELGGQLYEIRDDQSLELIGTSLPQS